METFSCIYGQECGGCSVEGVKTYQEFLDFKKKLLVPLYDGLGPPTTITSPQNLFFYRTKLEVRLRWREDHIKWGFFKKSSREFLAIENCLVAHQILILVLKKISGLSLRTEHLQKARLVLQLAENETKVLVMLICPTEEEDSWRPVLQEIAQFSEVIWAGFRSSENIMHVEDRNPEGTIWTHANAFRQGHIDASDILYDSMVSWLGGVDSVLELFCGNGSLLRRRNLSVKGYDVSELAIAAANKGAHFGQNYSVHDCQKSLPTDPKTFDAIVMDPPRQGIGDLVKALEGIEHNKVIYISCHIPGFLKDFSSLDQAGWKVQEWKAIDLLPWTSRWECLFLLNRP